MENWASCDEGASITGRRWFRRGLDGTFSQVALDMHGEVTLNRRYVTSDHALVVRNATETDVGFYVCHDNEEPPDEYRMEYLLDEVSQLNHEDNQVVYVDAATNATAASAAVVFVREAQDAPLTVRKVYTKLTSPQATEEAAILLALQTYENLATSNSHTRNHLTIYTDSQEAIRSLVKHHTTTTSPTIAAIFQSALRIHREHGTKTSVRWVPGHAGIQGNEAAHRAAREVLQTAALPDGHAKTARNLIPGTEPIEEAYDPKEEIRKIRAQVRKQILNTWTAEPYPIPEKIFKRHQTVLLRRVRTGGAITPHQTYIFELNRKRKTDPYFVPTDPRCHRCKHPDKLPKLQHLLWECEALRETRQTVWATLPPDEVPSSVREWTHPIGDAERRTRILGSLLEFISSGGLSNSL
ncbi:uncharacterized protein ISCGN_026693 [Ixodes scapularis]